MTEQSKLLFDQDYEMLADLPRDLTQDEVSTVVNEIIEHISEIIKEDTAETLVNRSKEDDGQCRLTINLKIVKEDLSWTDSSTATH